MDVRPPDQAFTSAKTITGFQEGHETYPPKPENNQKHTKNKKKYQFHTHGEGGVGTLIESVNKNTKMLTKWVTVARKSGLTIAFCTIFRGAPHGDVRFGQNPHF